MDESEIKKIMRRIYGDNYKRAIATYDEAIVDSRRDFLSKYPRADITHFSFQPFLDSDGTLSRVDTNFISGKSLFDITSDTFKDNKEWTKYLSINNPRKTVADISWPEIWSSGGAVQKLALDDRYEAATFPKVRIVRPESFKIYVSKTDYFDSKLSEISVELPRSTDFNINEPYFAAICGTYIATYLSGVSMLHLKPSDDVHPIITSVMNFHVYFWIRWFMRYPDKIQPYMSELSEVRRHIPRKVIWKTVIDNYKWSWNLNTFRQYLIGKGVRFRNVRYSGSPGNYNGIYYETPGETKLTDKKDFCRYVPDRSNGFTDLGRKLMNGTIEVFVYAILGSQSKNLGAPIVSSASDLSFNVQDTFRDIVGDGIATFGVKSSKTNWVVEMQTSIDACNVIPNLAISPHSLLIPSNMLYREELIPGYNNKVRHVTRYMKFGVNKSIGYEGTTDKEESRNQRQDDTPPGTHGILGKDPKPIAPANETPKPDKKDLKPSAYVDETSKSNADETTTAVAIVLAIASFVVLKYVV